MNRPVSTGQSLHTYLWSCSIWPPLTSYRPISTTCGLTLLQTGSSILKILLFGPVYSVPVRIVKLHIATSGSSHLDPPQENRHHDGIGTMLYLDKCMRKEQKRKPRPIRPPKEPEGVGLYYLRRTRVFRGQPQKPSFKLARNSDRSSDSVMLERRSLASAEYWEAVGVLASSIPLHRMASMAISWVSGTP